MFHGKEKKLYRVLSLSNDQMQDVNEIFKKIYYKELQNELFQIVSENKIPEAALKEVTSNTLLAYLDGVKDISTDSLSINVVLTYLLAKSKNRTQKDFEKSISAGDNKTLKRILQNNDEDGQYNQLVQKMYSK